MMSSPKLALYMWKKKRKGDQHQGVHLACPQVVVTKSVRLHITHNFFTLPFSQS